METITDPTFIIALLSLIFVWLGIMVGAFIAQKKETYRNDERRGKK